MAHTSPHSLSSIPYPTNPTGKFVPGLSYTLSGQYGAVRPFFVHVKPDGRRNQTFEEFNEKYETRIEANLSAAWWVRCDSDMSL